MDFFESYKFLKLTDNDGFNFEFSIDREIGLFCTKAFIGIPTVKRWSELHPNLVNKREEVIKQLKEYVKIKSCLFYKYYIEEYE